MPNQTHNPAIKSWVSSANSSSADFPIQNLPIGVFRKRGENGPGRVGIAIGNEVLPIQPLRERVQFEGPAAQAANSCNSASLNALMALGTTAWTAFRQRLFELLRNDSAKRNEHRSAVGPLLVPMHDVEMLLPAQIGDYTDFYASIFHAINVGRMFRPENPLFPNYKNLPIGYHGRSSSIVVDGTPVRRPVGQTKNDTSETPEVGPSRSLDYELEVGFFIGPGNALGERIPIDKAEEHIFGVCLLNDWSARDIQKWEYQPLGPFLAKNFATTISPWVVTLEALEPFRTAAFTRGADDPSPLPYLASKANDARGGIDLTLEVFLMTEKMQRERIPPHLVSKGSFRDMYWTIAQMLAHHTVNGCNLRSGDLLGSGTVSGPTKESLGCFLEVTRAGSEPIGLQGGETRKFLQDGDKVLFRGYCTKEGFARIGFGDCSGTIIPAKQQ